MRKIRISDVESTPAGEYQSDRRVLTGPLDASHVAIVRYVLAPGERFSGSVHAHADQEELFVVLDGTATFETRDGEVSVGTNEAIRFAPGEFQSGRNDSDDEVVALALGAPRDSEDVRISRIPVLGNLNVACPECGLDSMRIPTDDESGLVCPDCEAKLEVE